MNKGVFCMWCAVTLLATMSAACNPTDPLMWVVVVMPLMAIGVFGFKDKR
jgi:hypothetical protein